MSHKASRRQFTDLRRISCWLKGEVKLIERLNERKASQACFHGHIPLHTGAHFELPAPDRETPHRSNSLWRLPRRADQDALAHASTSSVPEWPVSAHTGARSCLLPTQSF